MLKEQDKTKELNEKELNEMEASSLPDTELISLVTRILNEFRERMDELSGIST